MSIIFLLIDLLATRPLEYMFDGDIASVATQYSYLPSWLSLITDQTRSKNSVYELVTQLHEALDELPEEERPRLFLFGESLGSYGIESAFPSTSELFAQAEGTLLIGTPGFNPLKKRLVEQREEGSPEYLPIYQGGREVRFYTGGDEIKQPKGDSPRLIYINNPTDPVTKLDTDIALSEPGWAKEQFDHQHSWFEWHPVVSLVQISVDMILSFEVPPGYGHHYGTNAIDAWAALAKPHGWDEEKSNQLKHTNVFTTELHRVK